MGKKRTGRDDAPNPPPRPSCDDRQLCSVCGLDPDAKLQWRWRVAVIVAPAGVRPLPAKPTERLAFGHVVIWRPYNTAEKRFRDQAHRFYERAEYRSSPSNSLQHAP